MKKRNKYHRHKSKGLNTKYGGPVKGMKVNWAAFGK